MTTTSASPARRASRVAAALGLLSALLLLLAPSASATTQVQGAANALSQQSPLYIAPGAEDVLGGEDTSVRGRLSQTGTPVFVAVLTQEAVQGAGGIERVAQQVARGAGEDGTYLVVSPRGLYGVTNTLDPGQVRQIVGQAAGSADAAGPAVLQAVDELGSLSAGDGSAVGSGSGSGGGGSGALTTVLLFGLLAGGGALLMQRGRSRKRQVVQQQESMAEVRTVADEDVTRFGEDIAKLDLDVDAAHVDDATRGDYAAALDSYDVARQALDRARSPEDLAAVSTALEDGRYRMECVRARMAGQPVPERRPPCFFNPQHGSSVQDVDWAPPGGQVRPVPACAPDANRVMHGEDPDARQVLVAGEQRPYWEAGPAYGGWAGGYFGGRPGMGMGMGMGGILPGIMIGTMLGGSMGGFGGGGFGGYDGDQGGGGFGGGGGGDWGGGGGDFGGGGGDFGGGGGDFGGGGD